MRTRAQSIFAWILLLVLGAQGKLVFRPPLHPPRIYSQAPDGVHVTSINAYDPDWPRRTVTYSLLDVKDHAQFAIDPDNGNLTTAATVEQDVGFVFHVIVVALSQGSTELRKLEIVVSEYNRYTPEFDHSTYRSELHVLAPIRTPVLIVDAKDQDVVPYNAQVFYHLDNNVSSGYFDIDPESGQLSLVRTLTTPLAALSPNLDTLDNGQSSTLQFGVYAKDGGSPARWAYSRVQIHVKNISEPQNVRAANPTDTTVDVCWSRPLFGQPLGYLIKYRELVSGVGGETTSNSYLLNVTTNAHSKCTTISRLRPWTDYQFRVYAWNHQETGIASEVGTMGTRPNYCQMNVCKQGTCQPLNVEPGYWCECPFGFYGSTCELFDACSTSPCQNFGACRNTSHNEYECECLSGFSGRNCSQFNPCAIRPSPCLNGGECRSSASHTYECHCQDGFYGKTCQNYDPCISSPCANGAKCHNLSNSDYACACQPGFSGLNCEWNVDECSSSPCANGATCVDKVNGYRCVCPQGYHGHDCSRAMQCPREVTRSDKGILIWDPTDHGSVARATCPFGYRPWQGTSTARRRCRLLPSGEVAWAKVQDQPCREEAFRSAEIMTEKLELMTEDPSNLTASQVKEAVTKMLEVVDFAARDPKIARSLFNVVSNMMTVNESVLEEDDAAEMIVKVVDRYMSEVQLEPGQPMEIETENLALKAVTLETHGRAFRHHGDHGELSQALSFRTPGPIAERRVSFRDDNNAVDQPEPRKAERGSHITIPLEALERITSQEKLLTSSHPSEVRLKFVSYRNSRLFPSRDHDQEERERGTYLCQDPETGVVYSAREPGVLQASIQSSSVQNLSDPVIYVLPAPACFKPKCVYWDADEKVWSTEGVWSNMSGNTTICYASHLTAFSILFDLDPDMVIPDDHKLPLSIISYLGSALSVLGLLLTIITYTLFRCLNRDRSGKILLNLCVSLLLLNISFLAGSQRGLPLFAGLDVCVLVAVLLHYFLLSSLAWMGMEALNMYQLLIHVFASSESRFMLKRCLIGWGAPLIIVGVTVAVQGEEYFNRNDYCMLSPTNPYVYYISYLGPSCLILLVNLSVFIMVARVLFAPRLATTTTSLRKNSSTGQQVVTLAQVRGAFTVMVLLGVTWVFGALAVGELKLFFQYVFCVCNSLQGFLIFIVRCLCYPEARMAWAQLFRTGTLKKYRGMVPPGTGSWYGNSSSNPQNKTPKPRSKRTNSNDSTTTVVFNSNYWNTSQRLSQTVSQAIKNANLGSDAGWPRTCHTFAPLGSSVQSLASGASRLGRSNRDLVMSLDQSNRSNLDRLSTINYIDDDDQETRTESSSDVESYSRRMTLPLVPGLDISSQSSACTRSSQTGDESPVCRFCNRNGCNGTDHNQCLMAELSFIPL